eukprot:6489182-Amphidinium_carterae.1
MDGKIGKHVQTQKLLTARHKASLVKSGSNFSAGRRIEYTEAALKRCSLGDASSTKQSSPHRPALHAVTGHELLQVKVACGQESSARFCNFVLLLTSASGHWDGLLGAPTTTRSRSAHGFAQPKKGLNVECLLTFRSRH